MVSLFPTFTQTDNRTMSEICYGYRYTEKKQSEQGNPWRIRQSGLYHRLEFTTDRSIFILISPLENSSFEQHLIELLGSRTGKTELGKNPLLVHHMFISNHLPDMMGYLLYWEEELEPIVSFSD